MMKSNNVSNLTDQKRTMSSGCAGSNEPRPPLDDAVRTPLGGTPVQPEDPLSRVAWRASWLRDPVFKGIDPREFIHPDRKPENNGEIRNIHTLFRKEICLHRNTVRQARLYITADDCYKLYVDGAFIGTGPAPAYPFSYPYNAWDVTDSLTAGEHHCLGVHTFYHGMHSLAFPSGDNLQGLLVQLEVDYHDGSRDLFLSDCTWRCLRTDAYEARQVYGYQTAFSEHMDLRKLPVGWNRIGFEGKWMQPLTGPIPDQYALAPQQTPPVTVSKRSPVKIVRKGDGHYFIDFGTEFAGETAFIVSGESGQIVEIRHGEELDAEDTVRYDMRCNCEYREFCTLSGRPDELLTFFDYKGFRYAEVLNWPGPLKTEQVWAHERHYPFPEDASRFESSEPLLTDIWKLCRNGVRAATIDTYLDCPTREKGGFLGDGYVTGMSHLVLTGDPRILRKFLKDVADTNRYCAGLLSTAPNYINGELAEYSLLWPLLLEYYCQWTGDLAFLGEMLPVLQGLLAYYAAYENEDGLLQDLYSHATGRYSILVDWPMNLRDEYDDPYLMGDRKVESDPSGVVNTMIQGFYIRMLECAGRLAETAGSGSIRQAVGNRAERVRSGVLRQLRNTETGLFIDRNGSDHSALHANVTALLAGVPDRSGRDEIIRLIREKRLSCGVYFSFFVLKALYDAGEPGLAYDLITGRDLHSWHSMLEAGATTCMEAWAPDLKWNTSWCHPWSSAPIYMITHEIFGLCPDSPGWKTIRFAPQPPDDMSHAAIAVTTPQGRIEASFTQTVSKEPAGRKVTYVLKVPEGCPVRCVFPESVHTVVPDGDNPEIYAGEAILLPRGGEKEIITWSD